MPKPPKNLIVTDISFVGYTWLTWQGGSDVGTIIGEGMVTTTIH